jgi:hypothetical protein
MSTVSNVSESKSSCQHSASESSLSEVPPIYFLFHRYHTLVHQVPPHPLHLQLHCVRALRISAVQGHQLRRHMCTEHGHAGRSGRERQGARADEDGDAGVGCECGPVRGWGMQVPVRARMGAQK